MHILYISEQNIKEPSYISFISFCNLHNKLILESNRVNFKIREHFSHLKVSINLGFLAKHIIYNKDIITFEEQPPEKSLDVIVLEQKLKSTTKKYYKYKAKYLESKDIDIKSALIKHKKEYHISDTSSINPTNSITSLHN